MSVKRGWLVNDCLTCIPGTRTLWHDLLDWIPGLMCKCNGYTPYPRVVEWIDEQIRNDGMPDFVIRNGTYFGRLNTTCPTLSLIQDGKYDDPEQVRVANSSSLVVYNSEYTKKMYVNRVTQKSVTIPLGTDFDHFKPFPENDRKEFRKRYGIPEDCILWVGSHDSIKGFELAKHIVDRTPFNYCFIFKDRIDYGHPRVRTFLRVTAHEMREIMNACRMILCTSVRETQHLAGMEAGACGLPAVSTGVGSYANLPDGKWGKRLLGDHTKLFRSVLDSFDSFDPRSFWEEQGMSKAACKAAWLKAVQETCP